MRLFALFLQYAAIAFAIFLCFQIGMSVHLNQFDMMNTVANVGTILVCIDLAVFLWHSRSSKAQNLQDYANQLEKPAPTFIKVSRKMGHFGILLIITSWIVPLI